LFVNRNANSNPYVKLFITDNETNNIEMYSQFAPNTTIPFIIQSNNNILLHNYNNIRSITVDNTGRIYEIDEHNNNITNMTSFNIVDNNNNILNLNDNSTLNIIGKNNHIKTTITNNNIEFELENTNVISNVDTIIELRLEFNQINTYDPINLLQNEITLIKDITYKFEQINLSYQHGQAISISTSFLSNIDYTNNLNYYYTDDQNNLLNVTKLEYVNSFNNNNITNRYFEFTPVSSTPNVLYFYSNNSNAYNKLKVNISEDKQTFSNIKSLSIDKYGRIDSIVHNIAVLNNTITFTLKLGGYLINSFNSSLQVGYKTTLSSLLNIDINKINILTLTDDINSILVETNIIELADTTTQNIQIILDDINTDINTRNIFINNFRSNNLSFLNTLTLMNNVSISTENSDGFNGLMFTGNTGDNITITENDVLNIVGNTDSINVISNNTLKSVEINLNETGVISNSNLTELFTNNISELTIDKYGRVHNVVTGSGTISLPTTGITAGTFGPGISNITVNNTGTISSITTLDYAALITAEQIRAQTVEGILTNLNTTDKTSLVNAINEEKLRTETVEGILANLNTTDKTSLVNAINEEKLRTETIEGDLTNLNTTDKSSLVNAINDERNRAITAENAFDTNITTQLNTLNTSISNEENRAELVEGDLTTLNTIAKSSLVDAINELKLTITNDVNTLTTNISNNATNITLEETRATTEETAINTRIDNLENNFATNIEWKDAVTNLSALDTLIENNVSSGWVYFIETENRAYIIIDNISGTYRPSGWTNLDGSGGKSFLKIADFTDLSQLVNQEQTRAIGQETLLDNKITIEENRAIGEETRIEGLINIEENRAIGEETRIEGLLNNEISRIDTINTSLTTNVNTLQSNIDTNFTILNNSVITERNRAESKEGDLTTLNTLDKTTLVKAINETLLNLNNEITRATNAENILTTNLTNEITRATTEEFNLNNKIDNVIDNLVTGIEWQTSYTNLNDLDLLIENNIELGWVYFISSENKAYVVINNINGNYKPGSWTNKSFLQIADYSDLANLVTLEETRAINAETTIQNNLNTEITRAQNTEGNLTLLNTTIKTSLVNAINENTLNITNNTTNITSNYTTLDTKIDNEITRASTNEGNLTLLTTTNKTSLVNAINENVININTSNTNISNNFTTLDNKITTEKNRINTINTQLSTDIPNINTSISTLNTTLSQNITNEETRAIAAETSINTKINKIGNNTEFDNYLSTNTVLSHLGNLNNIPNSLTVLTYLQYLGNITDYSTNSLISKIGNISNISTTLKDIIDAIGDVTTSYNQGSTFINDLYTKSEVDTKIADLVNGAPATLDTLNELSAALNDDANFATTVTALIGTKQNVIDNTSALYTDSGNNIISNNLTAGRALIANASGKIAVSTITDTQLTQLSTLNTDITNIQTDITNLNTNKQDKVTNVDDTEISYLNGVTSNIQIQIDSKQNTITGAASTILSSDLTIDRALLSDGSGKVAVSAITNTELSYLDGVTSNIQTQINNKQNTITGATSTILSSDLTINRALLSDSSGKVAVSAVTNTELGYLSGVTSNIQTQVDSKQNTITGGATTLLSSNLTINRALLSDGSGKVAVSSVTNTELGYLSGVTSNIQTQVDNKQNTITGAASTILSSDLTIDRALLSNGSGKVAVSAITNTELGYLSGVTSNIQTQIDNKQNTITGAASTISSSDLTIDRALLSDGSGKVAVSTITNTELGYLDGVTSNIQTQIDDKQTQINKHNKHK
jgi:hypothetical protein